jgi:hypothetical protein
VPERSPENRPENLSRVATALSGPKTYVIDPRFRTRHYASVSPAEVGDAQPRPARRHRARWRYHPVDPAIVVILA